MKYYDDIPTKIEKIKVEGRSYIAVTDQYGNSIVIDVTWVPEEIVDEAIRIHKKHLNKPIPIVNPQDN